MWNSELLFFSFRAGIYTATEFQWEGRSHSQKHGFPDLSFSLNRCIRLSHSSFHASHSHKFLVLPKRPEIVSPNGIQMALVALQGQFLWKRSTFLSKVCSVLGTNIKLFHAAQPGEEKTAYRPHSSLSVSQGGL